MDTTRRRRAKLVPEGRGAPPSVSGLADGRPVCGKPAAADVVSAPTVDLAAEDAYWREHFSSRFYVEDEFKYSDYAPAYRLGCQARFRFPAQEWERIESVLERAWPNVRRLSQLEWDRAKLAARDAWDRCSAPPAEPLPSDAM